MGKIVAIGGGEIGRPGTSVETAAIDREIIRLCGAPKPKLLFIPTASGDAESYIDAVRSHFGEELGCIVDSLSLIKEKPAKTEIKKRILGSDIIYVGGGNTLKMLRAWRSLGVDKVLTEAFERGIVLSGVSAGAICWFKFGSSDSRKFRNPEAGLIRLTGLGLVNGLCCPHYNVEADRRPHLKALMKKTSGVAIALDNCSAIEVVDDSYRIITSNDSANAYRVYWRRGDFHEEVVEQSSRFAPVQSLFTK